MRHARILHSIDQLNEIDRLSGSSDHVGVLIFKHSTRCYVSSSAYRKLENEWDFGEDLPLYYLDLIRHRDISDAISRRYGVDHESPQVILVKNGVAVGNASHHLVSVEEVKNWL